MDREEKAAAVAEIGEELDRSTAVFAVDYRGISVPQAAELRTKLNDADASFNVVKNRLAKRATEDAAEVGCIDQVAHGVTKRVRRPLRVGLTVRWRWRARSPRRHPRNRRLRSNK